MWWRGGKYFLLYLIIIDKEIQYSIFVRRFSTIILIEAGVESVAMNGVFLVLDPMMKEVYTAPESSPRIILKDRFDYRMYICFVNLLLS